MNALRSRGTAFWTTIPNVPTRCTADRKGELNHVTDYDSAGTAARDTLEDETLLSSATARVAVRGGGARTAGAGHSILLQLPSDSGKARAFFWNPFMLLTGFLRMTSFKAQTDVEQIILSLLHPKKKIFRCNFWGNLCQ